MSRTSDATTPKGRHLRSSRLPADWRPPLLLVPLLLPMLLVSGACHRDAAVARLKLRGAGAA